MAEHARELSRREREILDIVIQLGSPTATEVRHAMHRPPTDGAVRGTLRILVSKGHLKRRQDGPRYRYLPARSRRRAIDSALKQMLDTFFEGSTQEAMTALLELKSCDLSDEQRQRLRRAIDRAREQGR